MRIYDWIDNKTYCYDLIICKKNILTEEKCSENDSFESYKVSGILEVKGKVYIDNNSRENKNNKVLIMETMNDYKTKMKLLEKSNYQWMLNILEKKNEVESIVIDTINFLVVKDYKWKNHNDYTQLHLLAICKDQTIRSIRDLKKEHVPILKEIRKDVLNYIMNMFNINENKIKITFHYPPSTYILHIHFRYLDNCDESTSFEFCVDYDSCIFHLENETNYFKGNLRIVTLN
jgi:m7GpppX diphosphatase